MILVSAPGPLGLIGVLYWVGVGPSQVGLGSGLDNSNGRQASQGLRIGQGEMEKVLFFNIKASNEY